MTLALAQEPRAREVSAEPDPYLEVARRFFNEFLELKIGLERDGTVTAEQQKKEQARFERELKKWREANEQYKGAAAALAKDNERLEAQVLELTTERDNLRRQVNELLMSHNETARKLREYPLDQHMSEAAFREWEKILTAIPTRRG